MRIAKPATYYVYIATDTDNARLEVGVTADLVQKFEFLTQENRHLNANHCLLLLYWEVFMDARKAVNRENALRKFSFKRKMRLIANNRKLIDNSDAVKYTNNL